VGFLVKDAKKSSSSILVRVWEGAGGWYSGTVEEVELEKVAAPVAAGAEEADLENHEKDDLLDDADEVAALRVVGGMVELLGDEVSGALVVAIDEDVATGGGAL